MSTALTGPALRWRAADLNHFGGVASRRSLATAGIGHSVIAAHLRARRWRRIGTAIVLHNGELSREQRELVALVNCGPRAVLTSFTAAARWGLSGWERDELHVLAPAGTRCPSLPGIVLHRAVDWPAADTAPARQLHRIAPALLVAAGSFARERFACAIVAAGVQQRLVTASSLRDALEATPKLRHCGPLRLAFDDIAQGAQALSEIDFRRLCKRNKLPMPRFQAVRVEPSGRRRYLDAAWDLPDGRVLAAEVDGAIHIAPISWIEDQLRQNEVVLGGTTVLRYPSVVVRCEERVVVDQLRRGLRC